MSRLLLVLVVLALVALSLHTAECCQAKGQSCGFADYEDASSNDCCGGLYCAASQGICDTL